MSFICERCGECFSSKQRLQTHMSRKVLCVQKSENIGGDSLNKPVEPARAGSSQHEANNELVNDIQYTCKYCGKTFKWNSDRNRHQAYRCKHIRPPVLENTVNMSYLHSPNTSLSPKVSNCLQKSPICLQKSPIWLQKSPIQHTDVNNTINYDLTCEYCGKTFTLLKNKTRHVNERCKKKNEIIYEKQKQIDELQEQLTKKNKKIAKQDKTIERVYTEKEVLSNAVNGYSAVAIMCKNSHDFRFPTLRYDNVVPRMEYNKNVLGIEYNKVKEHDPLSDSESDEDNDEYNDEYNDEDNDEIDDNKKDNSKVEEVNIEDIKGDVEDCSDVNKVVKFGKDMVECYVNLGVRVGISTLIKKLLVDNYKISDRGVWCVDTNRSNFVIKRNGVMVHDKNGQKLMDLIMPGVERVFFDDLDYWTNDAFRNGELLNGCNVDYMFKRQAFIRGMRDKKMKKKIVKDICSSLYADRKEILEQVKQSNFDNINIQFDNSPIIDGKIKNG